MLPALDDYESGAPLTHVDEPYVAVEDREHLSDWIGADGTGWAPAVTDQQWPTSFDAAKDIQIRTAESGRVDQGAATSFEVEDVVVGSNDAGPILYDPVIDDYVLAPEVPRMCRTCAAFRPAEDGERGWCSNGWAFDNRLLVSAWDVPCQTSFGNWWLPNDDNWNDGVVERLHAPAPLFDQLMAQRTPTRRERSGQKKRWS